jgi:hypothetical protein
MPYQPFDTGWIKSIYGGICLAWYLYTRDLLIHVASVICYNNIFIPIVDIINKFYEFIGNAIISFGSGIIHIESIACKYFNYVDPIYNGLKRIESIFSNSNIYSSGTTFNYQPANIRSCSTSTGKHLCSYFARKRRHRRRSVISGSNQIEE